MQYPFLIYIIVLLKVAHCDEDEIECYSCRHDIYDGVPEGDDNCEVLTGNLQLEELLHYYKNYRCV